MSLGGLPSNGLCLFAILRSVVTFLSGSLYCRNMFKPETKRRKRRKILERKRRERVHRHDSATVIQRHYRGVVARVHYVVLYEKRQARSSMFVAKPILQSFSEETRISQNPPSHTRYDSLSHDQAKAIAQRKTERRQVCREVLVYKSWSLRRRHDLLAYTKYAHLALSPSVCFGHISRRWRRREARP